MLYVLYLVFIWVLCCAREIEDNMSEAESFKEFCKSLNLEVLVYPNCIDYTLSVFFQLENPDHKGCFHFYNISVTRGEETVDAFVVEYNDTMNSASHQFENITFGLYKLHIRPICTIQLCPNLLLCHPLINMSSDFCTLPENQAGELIARRHERNQVIVIAVTSSILLLIVSGLIYLAGRKKHDCSRIPDFVDDKNQDTEMNKNAATNIKVYIFHYYDRNKKIKKKVEILKDFLLKFSYFSSVRGIDDELAVILFDVNHWLNEVLDEKKKDGTIRRIILITSDEENDPDDDEIENVIFNTFIKKLDDNVERCLTGYDNLFVVQLDGSSTCSKRFKNIVRRDRYSLAGTSMQDHMVDLCLNLCSGLNLDMCHVENRIKELLFKHPVRHLGNCVGFLEHV